MVNKTINIYDFDKNLAYTLEVKCNYSNPKNCDGPCAFKDNVATGRHELEYPLHHYSVYIKQKQNTPNIVDFTAREPQNLKNAIIGYWHTGCIVNG